MTIIRDGKEIVLNDLEVYKAYLEQQHKYDISDVDAWLFEADNLTFEQVGEIAQIYRRDLDAGAYPCQDTVFGAYEEWRAGQV